MSALLPRLLLPRRLVRPAIIRTVGLTKVYPGADFTAVDALDLEVRAGEIFGLLGPNGAGKTTTVGMLTTRVIPSAGKAIVAGIDVVADPPSAKARVGVVSQTNTLDRRLTVRQNLYFHGPYFGMGARAAARTADALLELFRLSERADADVSTLSGGMAQRLLFARAVAHRPDVLFLDEPTSGLDPQSRLALWEILGQIHREGQTIVLTTHFMEEADRLCQRVAIMDHGRILALDTPEGLKRTVGGDTIVRVQAGDEPDRLAAHLRDMEGVTGATGQGVGGAAGAAAFSSILVPGVVAIACIFQGIQAVALPLVQDFGYSREIEDRVMAPLPVWSVAVQKVVAGALQGLIAAAIVFPLAMVVPATPVHLDVRPLLLFTLLPLAAVTAASLGMVLGTRVNPRQVPLLFGIVVIPIVFLGATYYPWSNLTPIPWLKALVLLNPLVYMRQGMRVSLAPQVPHMSYAAIYGGMIGFSALFLALGIDGFRKRVRS